MKPVMVIQSKRSQHCASQGLRRQPRLLTCVVLSCLLPLAGMAQTTAPALLPPEAQEAVHKGVMAAKQQDFLLAVRYFQDARKLAPQAPEIYYDLGLAESKIPGRELRAIAWFGAYLAASPNAPNAAAVKDQIEVLEVKSQSNISLLIHTVQNVATKIPIGDPNARRVPGHRHDVALEEVAGLWARFGDFEAAKNAIGLVAMPSDFLGVKKAMEEEIVYEKSRFAIDKAEVGDIAGAQRDAQLLPAKLSDDVEVSIAGAQANAGDISEAFKTVDSIHDTDHKNWALGKIAEAQAKAGDITSALKTIDLNPQLSYKSETLREIAERQVKAGDIAGALRTASLIPEGSNSPKAHVYSSIAEAQVKAGDTAGALETVELMHDEQLKGYRLEDIARRQLKAADIVGAQKTVDLIVIGTDAREYTLKTKCSTQVAIAEAQVMAGDIAGAGNTIAAALKTANALKSDNEKDSSLRDIAGAQANAGDISGAFKTVDSIQGYKNFALGNIAEAQAKAGDIASALKTAQLPQDAHGREVALAYIANGQAKAGDIGGAKKTADSIQDAVAKTYALGYIVYAQVNAREITDALKTTDLIQDAETKNRLQSYIAAAQAETRSRNNPRGTVISATVRVPAQPAITIIQAADWLKKLDDGGKTNDCALNTGPFLDLAGYLKSLPQSDDTEAVFKTLSDIVRKIIIAHHDIDKMLKQQTKK